MAASDHLNPSQFYHSSLRGEFTPGQVLTPQGANNAGRRFNSSSPEHVYYTNDITSTLKFGGLLGHVYAVQPEDREGSPLSSHEADPNLPEKDFHAYRTDGQLRVLHELPNLRAQGLA